MTLQNLYKTTINIERKVPAKDTSGGQADNFQLVPALQNIPCTIQPRIGLSMVDQHQRQIIITHVIYLDSVEGIKRGDIVYNPESEKRYLIFGLGDMADRRTVARIQCREVS